MKLLTVFLLYCTLFVFSLIAPTVVQAAMIFEDTFDSGRLDKWITIKNSHVLSETEVCKYYSGPAEWNIQSQRLTVNVADDWCLYEIAPKNIVVDMTNEYTFSFDTFFPENQHIYADYFLKYADDKNFYIVQLYQSKFSIVKVINDSALYLLYDDAYYPFQTNQIYTIANRVTPDHHIEIYVNGLKVVDVFDPLPTISEGTVGFRINSGVSFPLSERFDNVKIEGTRLQRPLHVPYLSQKDGRWGSQTYDSSELWAPANYTIRNWGCALTSAVMVLRYYGIDQYSTTQLTPEILNNWLKGQKDGYTKGNINWNAITRFVYLYHKKHPQFPALEFTRLSKNDSKLQEELNKEHPVILNVPGHFIVTNGKTEDGSAFTIKDPYYENKTDLSSYNNTYDSMRLFTPSYTDLRYIRIISDPSISVKVFEEKGEIQKYIDELEGDEDPHFSSEPIAVHEISKPTQGIYRITISSQQEKPFDLQVFVYSETGEYKDLSFSGTATPQTQEFALAYSPTEAHIQKNELSLLELLQRLRQEKQITRAFAFDVLFTIGEYLESHAETSQHNRYLQLFLYKLTMFENFLTAEAKTLLENAVHNK